jgi:hypothetical protein
MTVVVGLCAVALLGLGGPTIVQAQRNQERREDQKDAKQPKEKDKKQQRGDEKAAKEQDKATAQRQADERRGAPPDRGQQASRKQDQRRPDQERQELVRQHQQRLPEYREVLGQQQRAAAQRAAQLQQQKRTAQHRFQQEYLARLRQQQSNVQGRERYDYDRDPFFSTRSQYRYRRGDRYYETNQYGLDLIRQAVNYGYEEGFRAGQADREDHWQSNYEDCYAYQDANYGYFGFYVDRDDYNFYFREGFRRGYEDGYGRRYKYGRVSNGKIAILAGVLAGIVTYELIR